ASAASAAGVGPRVAGDGRPVLTADGVPQAGGDGGTTPFPFPASLSAASGKAIAVDWATAGDTAAAGSDYVAAGGPLAFAPGETTKTIEVSVLGDRTFEQDEAFSVVLSSPVNATTAGGSGRGTITNDDPLPSI